MQTKKLSLTLNSAGIVLDDPDSKYFKALPMKRIKYLNSKNDNIYECELMQDTIWELVRYFGLRCNGMGEEYTLDVSVRKRTKDDDTDESECT